MTVTSINKTTFTTDESTHELIAERWFDAPRELVFRAMTDAERIPRWWGRHGDVTRVEEMDVRPGGKWRFISRGPDGIDYPFKGEFLEIDPPSHVVQTFIFDVEGLSDHVSVVTADFTEEEGRTKMVVRNRFASAEDLAGAEASGMAGGQAETYERLEAELARG
ncbi:MAG: hypothetical protein QOI09_2155 [Chloroflexota bacterium]|jgi:uncharacterized protein YndB with AHSA1/START domain|nr:hypothetical protein [Chloroflexota bacterium]